MKRDAAKIKEAQEALDRKSETTAFTMDASWVKDDTGEHITMTSKRIGGPDPNLSLEELERNSDIARVRYLYAVEQENKWHRINVMRAIEYSDAFVAFAMKKYNLSETDLSEDWSQDVHGVFEKKDENK
jgi:hypothetical protein